MFLHLDWDFQIHIYLQLKMATYTWNVLAVVIYFMTFDCELVGAEEVRSIWAQELLSGEQWLFRSYSIQKRVIASYQNAMENIFGKVSLFKLLQECQSIF